LPLKCIEVLADAQALLKAVIGDQCPYISLDDLICRVDWFLGCLLVVFSFLALYCSD